MRSASPSRKVLVKRNFFEPVVMALPIRTFSMASRAQRTSMRFLGLSSMQIFCLILVLCPLLGLDRTDSSRIVPSWEDNITSFSIKSSRLIGAEVLDLFFSSLRLDHAYFVCSLRMMLVKEGARKEKKGLESFLLIYWKKILSIC